MAEPKKRGRPRKVPLPATVEMIEDEVVEDENEAGIKLLGELMEKFNQDRYNAILNDKNIKISLGNWYPTKTYSAKVKTVYGANEQHSYMSTYNFTTVGMIGGCGVLQSLGISAFIRKGGAAAFKEQILPELINDSSKQRQCGAIFATLGAAYFRNEQTEKAMKDMGWEDVATYPNYQHGQNGSYKQKMYILNIGKFRDIEKKRIKAEKAAKKAAEEAKAEEKTKTKTKKNEGKEVAEEVA